MLRFDSWWQCVCVRRWQGGAVQGLGHRAEVFDVGAHGRRLWEVDRFWFRKGFDGDFEFKQDCEGCPQGWNSTRLEEWGPEVLGQVAAGESWSEHHGCSLLGTTMSFSEWERGNERMNKKRRGWNKKLLFFFFCSKLQCTFIDRYAW